MKKKANRCKFCGTNSGITDICRTCRDKWKIIKSRKIWRTEHQKLLDEMSGEIQPDNSKRN